MDRERGRERERERERERPIFLTLLLTLLKLPGYSYAQGTHRVTMEVGDEAHQIICSLSCHFY